VSDGDGPTQGCPRILYLPRGLRLEAIGARDLLSDQEQADSLAPDAGRKRCALDAGRARKPSVTVWAGWRGARSGGRLRGPPPDRGRTDEGLRG